MNEIAYDTLKYMCIHLLIFLFKNTIVKLILDLSVRNISNKKKKELALLKQKRVNKNLFIIFYIILIIFVK